VPLWTKSRSQAHHRKQHLAARDSHLQGRQSEPDGPYGNGVVLVEGGALLLCMESGCLSCPSPWRAIAAREPLGAGRLVLDLLGLA
jgi:hypothetical protein